jgi:hypothetical protein
MGGSHPVGRLDFADDAPGQFGQVFLDDLELVVLDEPALSR